MDKLLYGDVRTARLWYKHLTMALLTKLGFIKSTIDSSLWFRDGLILVFYVDNGIIISLNNVMILHFIEDLREECKLDLGIEADYAGYLGVDLIKLPDGSMLMSQTGLIECILTDLGLKDSASSKITPAADILGPFKARPPFEETFNYWSVLGKILYVSSNTRCEITLANHQCARFSIDPRSPHGVALRQIGRYHLGSRKKGMIIKPTKDLTLDCYADADFAGLFSTSDPDDPKSVKSRSGYVITSARFLSAGEANCNPRRLFPQWKPNIYLSLKRFAFFCLFVSFSKKYPTIFISNMIRTPLSNPPSSKTIKLALHWPHLIHQN